MKTLKMNKSILTILFPLLLGIQFLYSQSSSAALKTAVLMEKRGNLESAAAIYEGLLNNNPKNLQAYQKLKNVYKRLEIYPKMVLLIKEHIKLFPNDLQSHLELGEAKYLNKNIKGAEKIWNDLESKFGNTPNTYRILMFMYSRLSLQKEMEAVVLRGRKKLNNQALLALDLANYYKARRVFDKAMDEFIRYLISNLRQKKMVTDRILTMSDEEEARSVIEKKILENVTKNEPVLRELAASFYFKTGNYNLAFNQHDTLGFTTKEDMIRWLGFADNLRQEGKYELAVSAYESLLSPELKFNNTKIIGQALLGLGLTFEDKIIPSQKNLSLIQFSPDNIFFENHYYDNQNLSFSSLKTAFRFYDSLLVKMPVSSFSASAHFRLGEIQYRITMDFDGASRSYEAALRSKPKKTLENNIRLRIGDIYLAKGDTNAALAYFEHERPRGTKFLNRLIQANFLAGRPDTTMILIESALGTVHPEAVSFNDLLELRDFIQQHYLSGSSEDQKAFELFLSSEFLIRQKKLSESAETLHYLQEQHPNASILPQAILREALIRKTLNQIPDALLLAERLTQTQDADIGWVLYGEILEKSENKPQKALDYYYKVLEEFPASLLCEPLRFHMRELNKKVKS